MLTRSAGDGEGALNIQSVPPGFVLKAMVAMDDARVIGKDGSIPWHLPEDLRRLSKMTTGHSVLMGRKTYESLPEKFRPLPSRKNIVLSRQKNLELHPEVSVFSSLTSFFKCLEEGGLVLPSSEIWVLGGAEIYDVCFPVCEELHLTRVSGSHDGDAFLGSFEEMFALESSEKGDACTFQIFKNKNARRA